VPPALIVFLAAALLAAAAGFWALRAARAEGAKSPIPVLTTFGVVIAAALIAYLVVGRPELAGGSYRDRLEATMARPMASWSPDEFLAVQAERAKENPTDPLPAFFSGEVLMRLNRPQEAARQYEMALRREPQLAEAMLGLGRAMVRVEGRVTPESLTLFEQAGALLNDPTPWIYQAMGAMQEGREADARRLWGEALVRMPEDDPRREMARRASRGELEQ
jgi:cytochrome c-type biogenesis protein CcmH